MQVPFISCTTAVRSEKCNCPILARQCKVSASGVSRGIELVTTSVLFLFPFPHSSIYYGEGFSENLHPSHYQLQDEDLSLMLRSPLAALCTPCGHAATLNWHTLSYGSPRMPEGATGIPCFTLKREDSYAGRVQCPCGRDAECERLEPINKARARAPTERGRARTKRKRWHQRPKPEEQPC